MTEISELTADEARAMIADVEDPELLEILEAEEETGKARKTVLEAIDARRAELVGEIAEPEPEASAPAGIGPPEAAGFRTSAWRGRANYECLLCPFTTLDEKLIRDHVQAHLSPAPPEVQARPRTDRFGSEVKDDGTD